jgi:6-phosphogluconolactonase/glucosamine-6-phosphate isomerase/deaminase
MLTRVFADAADLAARTADVVAQAIGVALRDRGRAVVVLAGGTTPRAAYELLAAGSGKREGLARALRGERATPAAWVRGTMDTLFLVDRAAAGPGPDATGRDVRYA